VLPCSIQIFSKTASVTSDASSFANNGATLLRGYDVNDYKITAAKNRLQFQRAYAVNSYNSITAKNRWNFKAAKIQLNAVHNRLQLQRGDVLQRGLLQLFPVSRSE